MKKIVAMALLALSSSAFALTATPGTACGAPGVGYEGIVSQGTEKLVAKQVPGMYVAANGFWRACAMPPACPTKNTSNWDSGDGRGRCTPGISSIRYGKLEDTRTVIDKNWKGRQTWQCTADGWKLKDAYCNK